MKPELRVALLGQGFMGKAHSNAYVQAGHFFDLPYRIRRRLLCGRDQASLTAMAERWGWEETCADWRAAIERDDIDAIDISLPNHLHAPVAIAAAQAGKMILCEKPLAMNLAEAAAMREAARGLPTMVWFNYRRVPAIAFARQLIDQGRIGTVFHYGAAYRQQWGADLSRAATWRMDPALAGSGVADDLLTHLLDTALYLNGSIKEGVALTRTFAPDRKVDDAFVAMVTFENGSVGTFEATRFGIGIKNGNAFQIHGANGMLRFNLERLNHLEFVDATQPSTEQGPRDLLVTDLKHPIFGNFWRPGHIIGYEHTFIAALAEFLFAVSKNERFRPDFADGVEVQRVLEALQRSARTREWVGVATEVPEPSRVPSPDPRAPID
jgi:predicted dehydrogenase